MARLNPLESEQIVIARRLVSFRETLGVPRAAFAVKMGISGGKLVECEIGRVPMKPGMVEKIKDTARSHLVACLAAYRKTFEEDAFPALATDKHTAMKLNRLPKDAPQTLEYLRRSLRSIPETLNRITADFRELETRKAECQAELTRLLASKSTSSESAARISTLRTQEELLNERMTEGEAAYVLALREANSALCQAACYVVDICQPLADQLRAEAAIAIQPFFVNAADHVRMHFAESDAMRSLQHFLQERRFFPVKGFATGEQLIEQASRWLVRVEALLAGDEVWSFHPGE